MSAEHHGLHVVAPGEGVRFGNVEFLALSEEGELTMLADGGELPAPAGTFVLVPPGVRHTFANRTGTPVRVLNVHAPARFDRRLMGTG